MVILTVENDIESSSDIIKLNKTVTYMADNRTKEDFYEFAVSKALWIYMSPVILALGTVGNLLSILVLCRRTIWRLSTSPYLVILALADMVVLWTGLLRRWLTHLVDLDIRLLSTAGCKIHVFCVYTSLSFSAWIIVLVTVERFVSIYFPLKSKTMCSRKKGKIAICVTFPIILLINLHILIGRTLVTTVRRDVNGTIASSSTICGHTSPGYNDFFKYVWPWIDIVTSSGLPFVAIIFCNMCILSKVLASHRRSRLKLARVATNQDGRLSSMTALLLSINTVFLITTAPSRIYLIGSPSWNVDASPHKEAALQLFWALCNQLMYLNNAVNFILYCVSAPRFRNELKALVRRDRIKVYPGQGPNISLTSNLSQRVRDVNTGQFENCRGSTLY